MTSFSTRHIGADSPATATMLAALGFDSVDAMLDAALPAAIRDREPLVLEAPLSEREALEQLRAFAAQNTVSTQMIGQGYSDTVTPAAIQRGVLDNPAWYTAYTPYQAEISQGRLEALLNFQTVISDLTGLPTAGASLLDEPTAVAEAMLLMRRAVKGRDERPIVKLRGISIMGVPLPNAWLGNLKNVDLVEQFGGGPGFWQSFSAGVDLIEIDDGSLHIQLKE